MHQARPFLRLETQPVEQRVDMALGVGAALHGEPGRLVDDNGPVVAVKDRVAQQCLIARPGMPRSRRRGRRRLGQRRHPDRLAGRDRVAGAGALAVDPDLAGAQQFFEVPVAQPRIMPPKPAVEPAGALRFLDNDGRNHRL